jgi:hypothetical protein
MRLTVSVAVLAAAGLAKPRAPEPMGAVTGGTGAYANARGVFVATAGKTGATDTITWRP